GGDGRGWRLHDDRAAGRCHDGGAALRRRDHGGRCGARRRDDDGLRESRNDGRGDEAEPERCDGDSATCHDGSPWTQNGPTAPLRNPDAGDPSGTTPSGVLTPPRVTATVGPP